MKLQNVDHSSKRSRFYYGLYNVHQVDEYPVLHLSLNQALPTYWLKHTYIVLLLWYADWLSRGLASSWNFDTKTIFFVNKPHILAWMAHKLWLEMLEQWDRHLGAIHNPPNYRNFVRSTLLELSPTWQKQSYFNTHHNFHCPKLTNSKFEKQLHIDFVRIRYS